MSPQLAFSRAWFFKKYFSSTGTRAVLEKYCLKKQGPILSNFFLYITRRKGIFPKRITENTSDSENNSVGRTGNARLPTSSPRRRMVAWRQSFASALVVGIFRSPLIAVVVAGVLCDKVGMHPPSQLPQPATLPPSLATRPLNARNLENIFFESSGAAAGPCWPLYLTNPRPRAPL